MLSLPLGAIMTIVIFIYAMGVQNLGLYLNVHSMILVGGGTLAILFFTSPINALRNLVRETKNLFSKPLHFDQVRKDLLSIANGKLTATKSSDELVAYAQDLWEQGISPDLFVVLISQKRKEIEQRAVDAIQCLKNLAKYPPALGMAGTVMGIVTLFQSLDGGKDKIGPALAVAMTATFFGLMIANAIVMPLSDRLQVRQISDGNYLQNIYQVLLLINQDESSHLIEEEVTSRAG